MKGDDTILLLMQGEKKGKKLYEHIWWEEWDSNPRHFRDQEICAKVRP